MLDNSATRAVKRSNLTLIIIGVVLMLLVLIALAASYRYMYNFVLGPFDVTREQLEGYSSQSDPLQYWVKVPALRSYDTGIQYFETKNDMETVKHSYHLLELGQRLLLYTPLGDQMGNIDSELTAEGYLDEITRQEANQVVADVESQNPELAGVTLPYKLNGASFRGQGWLYIIVGAVVGLIGLVMVVMGLLRMSNPDRHPIYKSLGRYGDPVSTANAIEMELQQPHDIINKNLHLLRSWLVYSPAGKFDALRYDDLMWLYQHIQTQRAYGVPVSRIRSIMAHDAYGNQSQITFGRKEQPVLDAIDAITDHAPWAVVGYDANLDKGWRKDRERFVAEVRARRDALKSGAQAYPGAPAMGDESAV